MAWAAGDLMAAMAITTRRAMAGEGRDGVAITRDVCVRCYAGENTALTPVRKTTGITMKAAVTGGGGDAGVMKIKERKKISALAKKRKHRKWHEKYEL